MVKIAKKLTQEYLDSFINKKFGKLTVIKYDGFYTSNSNKCKKHYFICKCDCGKQHKTYIELLRNGDVSSCGCYQKERNKQSKNKKYNKYDLTGDYGIGYTNKGEEFYFDLEDYNKIKDYCWLKIDGNYIISRSQNGKNIRIHRLIMDYPQNKVIDHINHNPSDNRKINLRICTMLENGMNKTILKNNTSGVTGVCKASNKWRAYIGVNEKQIFLGMFDDINDAIKARLNAEIKYFGEYRNKEDN